MPVCALDLTFDRDPDSYRFARRLRLTRPKEYKRVFADAKRLGDRFFTVLAIQNGLTYPRLGMAVPRRAVPSAVGRNRIKRLVRESFRQQQHHLNSWDLVVLCKAPARDASVDALRRALQRHWQQLSK